MSDKIKPFIPRNITTKALYKIFLGFLAAYLLFILKLELYYLFACSKSTIVRDEAMYWFSSNLTEIYELKLKALNEQNMGCSNDILKLYNEIESYKKKKSNSSYKPNRSNSVQKFSSSFDKSQIVRENDYIVGSFFAIETPSVARVFTPDFLVNELKEHFKTTSNPMKECAPIEATFVLSGDAISKSSSLFCISNDTESTFIIPNDAGHLIMHALISIPECHSCSKFKFIQPIIYGLPRIRSFFVIHTVVQNQALRIDEWIAYHIMLGVEHIYIYDINSKDGTFERIFKYVKSGHVTLISWSLLEPSNGYHHSAINHFFRMFKKYFEWASLIDIDDFFALPGGTPSNPPNMKKWLQNYLEGFVDKPSQLHVTLSLFGSSNHATKPEGLIIENYTRRMAHKVYIDAWPTMIHREHDKKEVIVSRAIIKFSGFVKCSRVPHYIYVVANEFDKVLPVTDITANHYYTLSFEEWLINNKEFKTKEEFEKATSQFNEVEDRTISKYGRSVRSTIKRIEDHIY